MKFLLIAAVALLGFANDANDNFKGVATLWGARRTTYRSALAWATVFTFLGSLAAIFLGSGMAAKFSGAKLVDQAIPAGAIKLDYLGCSGAEPVCDPVLKRSQSDGKRHH